MIKVMIFFLIAALLAGCSTKATAPIQQIYAFGDDFTDNGNCYKDHVDAVAKGEMSADVLKFFDENWEHRETNGLVAVEILAEELKVPLTDYATCAALSGQGNMASAYSGTGLLGQIDRFESELNGKKADPEALYYIDIGAVDLVMATMNNPEKTEGRIQRVASKTVANIGTAVTRLAGLGAKHFMISNSKLYDKYPGFVAMTLAETETDNPTPTDVSHQAEVYKTSFNAALAGKLQELAEQLNVKIDVFDFTGIEERIQGNPKNYGLTNITDSCSFFPHGVGPACAKPDEYYYWGPYYLTRVVNKIIGEAMAEQLGR